jgi:tetratricopeptide (TPR) repeat protein
MKKLLIAIVFGLAAIAAQAEATFTQVQTLIEQKQYSAAEQGLEVIIKNHPQSAKAFYAMSQAQAGLGNLEKAKYALDKARGLDPELKFASTSNVESLQQAITPQTSKIEVVTESHFMRNMLVVVLLAGSAYLIYFLYKRRQDEEEAIAQAVLRAEAEAAASVELERQRQRAELAAAEEAAREKLRQHKNYGNERFDPTNPGVLLPKKTKAQIKAEQEAEALREAQARADAAEADARRARLSANYVAPAQPAVVNNHYGSNNGGNDMLTGMLVGNMISNSGHNHSHDTTIIREREVYRDAPVRDSSWDTPAPRTTAPAVETKSSSWDDDSSSSKSSSSWSSSSSSSDSGSSWDSSSSSSDSSSSSSWD